MKLYFNTTNPNTLRDDIIKMIKQGKLETWEILASDGKEYLKHTGQWGVKGVIDLTPDTFNNRMKVQVLKFKDTTDDVKDFQGYLLGRFCELMFVNFFNRFTSIGKE